MGAQRGDAGADRDLGSRSRTARQKVQYGRYRPAVMDDCLARPSKTGMRAKNIVQRAVQLNLKVLGVVVFLTIGSYSMTKL